MNIPKYIADYAHLIWNEVKHASVINNKVPFNPPQSFLNKYKERLEGNIKSFHKLYKPGLFSDIDLMKIFDVYINRFFNEEQLEEFKNILLKVRKNKKNKKNDYYILTIKEYMKLHPEFEFELSNELLFYIIGLELFEKEPAQEYKFLESLLAELDKTIDDKSKNPSKKELLSDSYLEYTIIKEYSEFGLTVYSNKLFDYMIVNSKQ